MRRRLALCLALALALAAAAAAPAGAQNRPSHGRQPAQQANEQSQNGRPGVLGLLPKNSVTQHSIDTSEGKLAYTATAGTFSLFNQSGEKSAEIFYTAYVKKDAQTANRPLTFVFNGGPGASSAFLQLGLAGPRIVDFGGNGGATPKLRDNPQTWLRFTDLVFIDPVGTGWSRTAKPNDGKNFWGVEADANSLAKVIALYVAKNGRAEAPKYLLGESYGGFRAAKVARAVQRQQGIVIAGIVMVSPMLEGHFQFGGSDFALGAALTLPSLAAAHLERQHTFSQQALAAAERFAMTDYLTTLAGPPLKGEAAQRFYAKVADISGLPVDVIAKKRGFIDEAYIKRLAGSDKIVSHYDASEAFLDPFPENAGEHGPDPILDGRIRALGSAFVSYARHELSYNTEMTYELLASNIAGHWDWGSRRSPPSIENDLRILLAFDPSFHLLILHGMSDMVTPYMVSRYELDHLPPDLAARTRLTLLRGGHMMYLNDDSRRAMTADAQAFYGRSVE